LFQTRSSRFLRRDSDIEKFEVDANAGKFRQVTRGVT
jgi:hypothetical protein